MNARATQDDARDRVRRFVDAWSQLRDRDDIVYGLGGYGEDESRDLLASDLRLLTGESECAWAQWHCLSPVEWSADLQLNLCVEHRALVASADQEARR